LNARLTVVMFHMVDGKSDKIETFVRHDST
jgi:hypothetical protein